MERKQIMKFFFLMFFSDETMINLQINTNAIIWLWYVTCNWHDYLFFDFHKFKRVKHSGVQWVIIDDVQVRHWKLEYWNQRRSERQCHIRASWNNNSIGITTEHEWQNQQWWVNFNTMHAEYTFSQISGIMINCKIVVKMLMKTVLP